MKKRTAILFTLILILSVFIVPFSENVAHADELSDSVKDRLNDLELNEIEDYFDGIETDDFDFFTTINNLLEGKYNGEQNVFEYIKKVLFSGVSKYIPTITGIIVVALLCEMIKNIKSAYLSDSVVTVVKFVTILTVILLLEPHFLSIWNKTKNLIENIGKFSEIMSPVILTLMVASGGATSAALYNPTVLFFTNVVISLFYSLVLPLIGILTAFNVMSHFSKDIKLSKFSDFFSGTLKWIFGIIIVVYGFFITVQGLSASSTDGISAKIAKYAISNSVPIVGGLIKDGIDIVKAGSIIVKNAVGIAGVMGIFYSILSPLIEMIVFSLLLKLAAAVTDIFAGDIVPDFLATVSKSVNYFIASILTVGLMMFITALLMIFSANSVI